LRSVDPRDVFHRGRPPFRAACPSETSSLAASPFRVLPLQNVPFGSGDPCGLPSPPDCPLVRATLAGLPPLGAVPRRLQLSLRSVFLAGAAGASLAAILLQLPGRVSLPILEDDCLSALSSGRSRPSRYWFTIGHQGVFRLRRWSSRIHTEFHGLRATWDPARESFKFRVRGYHPLYRRFPTSSATQTICNSLPDQQL